MNEKTVENWIFSFESRNAEKLNEDQQMREMQWNAIIIYA